MPQDHLSFLQRLQEYGLLGYVWIMIIAFWAGTVKYLNSLKKNEKPKLLGWFVDTVTSGFVGVITAMVCQHYQLPDLLIYAITGIMAHNGTRSLYLIGNFLKKNTNLMSEAEPEPDLKQDKVYSKRSK